MLKIVFFNKKYYFNIFSSKKYFKKQSPQLSNIHISNLCSNFPEVYEISQHHHSKSKEKKQINILKDKNIKYVIFFLSKQI
jgi:hypothetical protein